MHEHVEGFVQQMSAMRFRAGCECGWSFVTATRPVARAMLNLHRRGADTLRQPERKGSDAER